MLKPVKMKNRFFKAVFIYNKLTLYLFVFLHMLC